MRVAFALALSVAVLAGAAPADDIDPVVLGVMTKDWRFSASDLVDLARGATVKHSFESSAPGEIAVVGAVRVSGSKQTFVDLVRDIIRFKRGPEVLAIGRFSNPPTLQDLASLTIDKDDFDPASCRLHDCDIRLPASVIAQVPHAADPAAFLKQVIVDDVTAYVKGETQGRLLEYDDGERPIRPEDEFDALLNAAPALGSLVPSLPDHFRKYPAEPVAADDDFL